MSNSSNSGTGFGMAANTTPAEEMAAFDALPPELRELINYSTLEYSAPQLARLSPGGVIQRGMVYVQKADQRSPIVAQIQAMNEAHGGPLAPRVARATVRRDFRVARSRRVLTRR